MKCVLYGVLAITTALVSGSIALGMEIFAEGDPILAIDLDGFSTVSGSGYPGGESPPNLIDGDTNTKYLNSANINSGFIVTPSAASTIRSFTLTTANDAPGRDPTSYALYGTNDPITSLDNSFGDAENWTLISEGAVSLPTDRFTAGLPVTFANSASYTSYRMHFPTLKEAGICCMQLSEAAFFSSTDGTGANILAPGDPILAVRVGDPPHQSRYPGGEPPRAAIDANVATKYLNFGENNSGFIITPAAGASIVDSFQITTANDAEERDPAEYKIYGTNAPIVSTDNSTGDAEPWTLITEGTLTLPVERQTPGDVVSFSNTTAYASYRVVFPTVKDDTTANSMQIADIQFFAQDPLTLEVNRDTGEVRILSDEDFTFHGYEIRSSTDGGLSDANWNSISSTSGDPDDAWVITSQPGDPTSLAEEDGSSGANNGVTIGAGQSISLGDVWLRTPLEDLVFDVRDANGIRIADGVTYIGSEIVAGDFNYDGVVDAGDWPAFRAGLGGQHTGLSRAEAYLKGDLDGDFDTDIFDYNAFVALVPGGAAALAGVPEPASLVMLAIGAVLMGGRRMRRIASGIAPVVGLAVVLAVWGSAVEAQTFTNLGQTAAPATSPDPNETADSGPEKLFDDTFLDGSDINVDLFTLNYADGNIFPPGTVAQYAGMGEEPKTVFMDFGSAIAPKWFAYAQRSGGDPTADRVGKFEFWFSNTDFGGTLPATDPDAVFALDADDDRLQDSILRPYPLGESGGNGRYVAMRLTVSDLSEPRPTNNIGGHEFRFLDGPSPVVLEVDRSNGNMTIKNNGAGAQAFEISAYEIKSALGALDAAGFNGIGGDSASFPSGNGSGNGWELGLGSNANRLFESYLNTDSSLAAGVASLPLGAAYNELFVSEDLTFRFTNAAGNVFDGVVQYVGVAPDVLPGDFNDNNVVDAADYTKWRDALGTGATLPNDPTPGVVDASDYNLWKAKFGSVGSGAAVGAGSAVPEPGSLAMIGAVIATALAVGRRRRELRVVSRS